MTARPSSPILSGLAEAGPIDSIQRALERLLEREIFYRAVLDGIEQGIVTTEASGTITFVNQAARKLLHVESPVSGDVRDLLGLRSLPEELLASTPKLSYVLPTKHGDELDLELSAFRTQSLRGEPSYFFIFRDMREERARSAERARLERLAAIGTMVAGFAHEVRNPVAALRSLAESLADDCDDTGLHWPHVSRMLQVLERVERLVRTSLQFGRPAAPRRGHHRPWTLVTETLGELQPRMSALAGEVKIEVEPDLPDVFVDDVQLIQVLVILVNNALDSVGVPSRVHIRIGRARGLVRFDVRDDGLGIPSENLQRIFDPFFTTKASGTGLGLSIAQHIVSENGGSIDVSSTRGGPTTFSVVVPARQVSGGVEPRGRVESGSP